MCANGVAVSTLYTGIPDFYRALGWRIAPRGILVVPGQAVTALAAEPQAPYEVNDYRPSDGEEVCRLYDAFNAGRPGSRIREISYAQATFARTVRGGHFARPGNGRLAGYVRAVPVRRRRYGYVSCAMRRERSRRRPAWCSSSRAGAEGLGRWKSVCRRTTTCGPVVSSGLAAVKPIDDVMCCWYEPRGSRPAWQASGLGDTVTGSLDDTAACGGVIKGWRPPRPSLEELIGVRPPMA